MEANDAEYRDIAADADLNAANSIRSGVALTYRRQGLKEERSQAYPPPSWCLFRCKTIVSDRERQSAPQHLSTNIANETEIEFRLEFP